MPVDLSVPVDLSPPPERYAWRVLSVTSLGVLLVLSSASTLEVALPAVVRGVGAGPTSAAWLLLASLLATTAGVLVLGRLTDVVGRRPTYLTGLAVFAGASLASGLAPGVEVLLALRVVAGVAAAAVITCTTPLLADAFPERLRTLGLGLNLTVVSCSLVVGPVAGGLLADRLGWRAVFWAFAPLGALALLWAARVLEPAPRPPPAGRFDLAGAAVSVLALVAGVLALSLGGTLGWTDPAVLLCGLAALVLWPVFALLQARRPAPLVDLALLADRGRACALGAAFAMSAAYSSVVLLLALYLQAARGEDATGAGVAVLPVALGMLLTAPLAGRLARAVDARVLSTAGLVVTAGGLLVVAAALSPAGPYTGAALGLALVGAGAGLFFPPNTDALVGRAPAGVRGAVNAVRSVVQHTGYVVGAALALALVTGPLTPAETRAAYAGTLAGLPGDELLAFTGAYRSTLAVLAGLALLGAVASALRPVRPELR